MQQQLCQLIKTISQRELMPRFQRVTQSEKDDGSLLTEADTAMQQSLQQALQAQWPHSEFLGEEMSAAQQQALLDTDKPLWIVDPLDGTSNYGAGIPVFGVSVALVEHNQVSMGVVYDPVSDECFFARKGEGAFLNGKPLHLSQQLPKSKIRIGTIDFKRLDKKLQARLIENPPYKSQRSFGSVVLDWCWLAAGRGDVYLHGKQQLWDYAAGQLILEEAGGYHCTLDGQRPQSVSLTPRSAVAAVNAELFKQWCAYLQINS